MGIFSDMRVSRLLDKVLTADDMDSPEVSRALAKIRELGKDGIPRVIQALATAGPSQRQVLSATLSLMLTNQSLPLFIDGLADPNSRIVTAVRELLEKSGSFDPNRLVFQLNRPELSEAALIKILNAHKSRLNAKELLAQACKMERAAQTPLFGLLAEIATESLVPDLVARASAKENSVRMNVTRVLAQFERPEAQEAMMKLLSDPQKSVRTAALRGIATMGNIPDIGPIMALLRDPDVNVQDQAIETIVKFRHPETLSHLFDLVQDESEHVRRGAVEVLNIIADADTIRTLLQAIRDRDWWVRERAADALVKIGGPRVVQAMTDLIRDEDEFIRRTAVEVLAAAQDASAFDQLLDSLEDTDWWVRERAIDALAAIGDSRAVPVLIKALEKDTHTRLVAIRALAELGAVNAIRDILPHLEDPEMSVRKQAIQALATLTDDYHAHEARQAINKAAEGGDHEVKDAAEAALDAINRRLGRPGGVAMAGTGTSAPPPEDTDEVKTPKEPSSSELIGDPSELPPGTMLGNRYQLIKKIGRGAFGTVLLFEDTVVNEQVILKFINPQFSADKNVSQRFVHEIRYARRITHENVIRIHDFLNFGSAAAISMEYFASHTLGDEMKAGKPLAWPYARKLLLQITSGLAAAHRAEVVHRDIKPGNILIDDSGLVKVVDFGIAAASGNAETRLTRTGMVVGTPAYLAPEQVLGKPIDNRTDMYSLGVIMYQMFAGHPPYKGEDAMSLMYQHVQGQATPLHVANPEVSKTVSAIVNKAMAVDPDKRYQTMDDLHDRLAMIPAE